MNGIKEYLISIISAVILATLADIIASSMKKAHTGIEKAVRLGLSLCIMAAVIVPITGIVSDSNSFNIVNYKTENYKAEESLYIIEKEAEEKTAEYIFGKTGIKPMYVRIDIVMNENENVAIGKAVVGIESIHKKNEQEIKQAALECVGREVCIEYAN